MTLKEAKYFLSEQKFTFAKSYASTYPHVYLQRSQCTDEIKYESFLKLIRKNGVVYNFYKKQYIYLEIDGFVYWEMGRPIKAVQVLNKADVNSLQRNKQYPAKKEVSDILKNKLKKREIYLNKLFQKEKKTEQELEQINFLMNSTRRIHGGGQNIIDNFEINIKYEK